MNAIASTDPTAQPRFIDNGDGTITDTKHNLMWTKDTISTKNVNQYEAEKICADCRVGGHDTWRLPDVEELFPLADRSRLRPAIDTTFFPDTHSDWYWTRTLYADAASRAAWFVFFDYGNSGDCNRGNGNAFVRACRPLSSGQ